MSKPISRVVLVSLVSLILIAATYMTVQGSFAKGDTKVAGSQAHVVSGLQTNFNHDRSTASEIDALKLQSAPASQPGAGGHEGGCESENHSSPLD